MGCYVIRIALGENGNTRQYVDAEFRSLRLISEGGLTSVYGTKSGHYSTLIAERRPDGKWYLSRDWDAPGYPVMYIAETDIEPTKEEKDNE